MVDGILVKRAELKQALIQLKKLARLRDSHRAYVFTEGGKLRIQTKSLSIGIEVEGDLVLAAGVSAAMLASAHTVLPKKDPLLIQIVGNELFIGTFSISCEVLNQPPSFIPTETKRKPVPLPSKSMPAPIKPLDSLALPKNMPDRTLLKLRAQHTPEDIVLNGLTGKVEKALFERNRRVTQALKLLSRYNVKHKDLTSLIDECVSRDDQA